MYIWSTVVIELDLDETEENFMGEVGSGHAAHSINSLKWGVY